MSAESPQQLRPTRGGRQPASSDRFRGLNWLVRRGWTSPGRYGFDSPAETRGSFTVGLVVLSLALTAVLATYALRGWFARYTADDYCTAGFQRTLGFVGAQVFWYETWSGRFSYYFVVGAVEYAGPAIVQVLPGLALAAMVAAGAWALRPIARQQGWPWPVLSAALVSAAVALTCVLGAPNVEQSLYWQTGMLTYVLPLVLMTIYAGWLVRVRARKSASRWDLFGSAALLLVSAGLAETSLAVQLGLLMFGTVLALLLRSKSEESRTLVSFVVTGLVASLLGALLVVVAPGNYLHELRVTGSVHSLSQLPEAFRAGIDFVGLFARAVQFRGRLAVILVLSLSLWAGLYAARGNRLAVARADWLVRLALVTGSIVGAWLLLLAAIVPGYFAQQWDVPERAQIVGVWVIAVALAVVGYVVGETIGQIVRPTDLRLDALLASPLWNVGLFVLAAVSLLMVPGVLSAIRSDAAYAAAWDSLDATIRSSAAAGGPVTVDRTLPMHYGFDFLTPDPSYYPNPCVAQFYGVPSIRVAQP